jgi:hypothetical protein
MGGERELSTRTRSILARAAILLGLYGFWPLFYLFYLSVLSPLVTRGARMGVAPIALAACIIYGGIVMVSGVLMTVRTTVTNSIAIALFLHVLEYILAVRHMPGLAKSYALEAPLEFWSIGPVLVGGTMFTIAVIGRQVARALANQADHRR